MDGAFDLSLTYVRLGPDGTATPLTDLGAPGAGAGGDDGRLVVIGAQTASWSFWERHPAGDELVVLLSGHIDVVQDADGGQRVVALQPGRAVVNPRGVWHTTTVHRPGRALFVTAGSGTETKPRQAPPNPRRWRRR